MAKRANPFLEDFVQQRKIHVGIKQFNNNKDRLQDVYDKTLQLLFDGAKKPIFREVPTVPNAHNPSYISHKADRKLKQLSIGNNGALLQDAVVEEEFQPAAASCQCPAAPAVSGSGGDAGRCAYCERAACAACGTQCGGCGQLHCARCSLCGRDGEPVCVSCYG